MRKSILLLFAMVVALAMAACGADANMSPEEAAAFDRYMRASEALMEAGSLKMESQSVMVMAFDGEVEEIRSTATASQVIHSETNVDMHMEMLMTVQGMSIPTTIYFRNGWYYMDMMGMGMRMPFPLEDVLEQANAGLLDFSEDAITFQEVRNIDSGLELVFRLDASAMSDLLDGMVSGMLETIGLSEDMGITMNFGDIDFSVILNDADELQSMDMAFTYTMEFEGEVIDVSMSTYTQIVQVGGVTINFPDYLDDFMEVDPAALGL